MSTKDVGGARYYDTNGATSGPMLLSESQIW